MPKKNVMNDSAATLRQTNPFARAHNSPGTDSGAARPRTVACKFDINSAAATPFPATSAMQNAKR